VSKVPRSQSARFGCNVTRRDEDIMETNRGISDADCRSDQRQRVNEAGSPKKVIATPDSAGAQSHSMLWQSYFCGCALNCIAMTSEVA